MKRFLGTLLLSALPCVQVAAEVVIVVHPENAATFNAKSVERIFLDKENKFSTGVETIPVNLQPGEKLRKEFDEKILGRSTSQISAYWSKLVFTGKGIPPKEVKSDQDVIALIKQNQSVIGYIDAASVTPDVRVVCLD
jgi:ABC-type phosphate transport system substrate-binding protein